MVSSVVLGCLFGWGIVITATGYPYADIFIVVNLVLAFFMGTDMGSLIQESGGQPMLQVSRFF